MSWSIILGAFWVLASTVVAMLSMRRQYVPGVALLILAPVLIVLIGYEHGVLPGLLALGAFVSMFRNPLRYLWRKATGRSQEAAE